MRSPPDADPRNREAVGCAPRTEIAHPKRVLVRGVFWCAACSGARSAPYIDSFTASDRSSFPIENQGGAGNPLIDSRAE
jgi:hypothetical protein